MLHIYLSNRPGQVRYGTTGWPVPGYEIELRGEDGQPVPDGEPGDLYIQGPSSALMYWNNRQKSRTKYPDRIAGRPCSLRKYPDQKSLMKPVGGFANTAGSN
jgi:acyl-coenzyme A synthetase/AMP-(fatty) acid ligase